MNQTAVINFVSFIIVVLFLPVILFAQTERTGANEINEIRERLPNTVDDQRPLSRPANNHTEQASEMRERAEERRQTAEERRLQMQDELEQRRVEAVARGEERRAALQERAQERLLNLAANMSNRMEAAIRRIDNVITRLESRIEKLKDTGVNTNEAEDHLATAKRYLTSASATLATIDTDVTQFITSNDPRAAWMRVKSIYESTRNDLRSAHQTLRDTVVSLGRAVAEYRSEQSDKNTEDKTNSLETTNE